MENIPDMDDESEIDKRVLNIFSFNTPNVPDCTSSVVQSDMFMDTSDCTSSVVQSDMFMDTSIPQTSYITISPGFMDTSIVNDISNENSLFGSYIPSECENNNTFEYDNDMAIALELIEETNPETTVFSVECKKKKGLLHKSKFGSGNKGQCVEMKGQWYTPLQYVAKCGGALCKDWRRTIKLGGRTLQDLISNGVLKPHAISCLCSNCNKDPDLNQNTFPIKYENRKKRRSNKNIISVSSQKVEKQTCENNYTSSANSKEGGSSGELQSSETNTQGSDTTNDNPSANSKEGGSSGEPQSIETIIQGSDTTNDNPSSANLKESGSSGESGLYQNDVIGSNTTNDHPSSVNSRIEKYQNLIACLEWRLRRITNRLTIFTNVHRKESSDFKKILRYCQCLRSEEDTQTCGKCKRVANAVCSFCQKTGYCSFLCQKKDIGFHKRKCSESIIILDFINKKTKI